MRFAPLIPHAVLAVVILLLQAVQLKQTDGGTDHAQLSFTQTDITSTFADSETTFSAGQVQLSATSSAAQTVRGTLVTAASAYRFAAERIFRANYSHDIEMIGNVFIAQGNRVLRTDWVVLEPTTGVIRGNAVRIEDANYYAVADNFVLDGPALQLDGKVTVLRP